MKVNALGTPVITTLAAAALALAGHSAHAQDGAAGRDIAREAVQHLFPDTRGERVAVDRTSLRLLDASLSANAGSIELARLAEDRARDREVREFARSLRQSLQDANRDLAGLSRDLDADRARPDEQDRWILNQLRQIDDDRDFERAYAELAVARHQVAIDRLELLASDERAGPAVRDVADRQIGDLRQQLRTAQRIEQDVRALARRD